MFPISRGRARDLLLPARNRNKYRGAVKSKNPVGWWRLNELPAVDSSGNGRNGAYVGGVTPNQSGAVGGNNSVLFDGSTGYVNCTNASALQVSTGTIEAWVKAPAPGASFRGIVVKPVAFGLFLIDGVLATYDWSVSAIRSTGQNVVDGAWHHVAMTFQSGVANGTVVYLDGQPVLTTTITVSSQANSVLIGAGNTVPAQTLAGTLDEVAIYNTALSAQDIYRNYLAGKGKW